MNSIPVVSDQEKFQKYIDKEFKKIYMDGFTNGMKTTAEIVMNILKDANADNYQSKINDVFRVCSPKKPETKENKKSEDNK